MKISSFYILAIGLILSACESREELHPKDGYSIIRIYGDAHSLMKPNGRELVMPNVVDISDNEMFIIGLRIKADPELILPEYKLDKSYGYFLYDKKKNILRDGLSHEELLDILVSEKIKLTLSSLLVKEEELVSD